MKKPPKFSTEDIGLTGMAYREYVRDHSGVGPDEDTRQDRLRRAREAAADRGEEAGDMQITLRDAPWRKKWA